jgi:uncharacterized membrane protein
LPTEGASRGHKPTFRGLVALGPPSTPCVLGSREDLRHDAHRARHISPVVAGNAWFTLLGFMGMYTVLAILWLFLIYREIELGPEPEEKTGASSSAPVAVV